MKKVILLFAVAALFATSCNEDPRPTERRDVVCILNQGNYSQHNGSLYLYNEESKTMEENVFYVENNYELGAIIMDGVYNNYGIGYILCSNPDKIEIIDVTSGQVIADPIEAEDGQLVSTREMTLGENYIFVTNAGSEYEVLPSGMWEYTNSFLSIFDATTNKYVDKIPVGSDAQDAIYYNNKVYVATKDGIVVVRCDGNDAFSVETTYSDANFAGAVKYMCVINNVIYASIPGVGIWAVDPTSGSTVKTYPVELGYDGYITSDTDGNIYTIVTDYMAGTSNVYKLNVTSGNYTVATPAGQEYYSVGVSPSTGNIYYSEANGYTSNSTLYVADENGNVIDTQVAGVAAYRYLFFSYIAYVDEEDEF